LIVKPHKPAGRGKPGDPIIEKLSIKYVHKDTSKPCYSCIAVDDGCKFLRSGNAQKDRVVKHAAHCDHVSKELKQLVDSTAAQSSLGAKLGSNSQAQVDVASAAYLESATAGLGGKMHSARYPHYLTWVTVVITFNSLLRISITLESSER